MSAAAEKQRAKLSFKDQHALETLPGTMDKLHAEIDRLQGMLADPALYTRDAALFARTTETLSAAQAKLADAEEQWLTLEMLREEIEG